jgi:hypothetical protein
MGARVDKMFSNLDKALAGPGHLTGAATSADKTLAAAVTDSATVGRDEL